MESTNAVQEYDLMFITDATGSMGRFLDDLKAALPQIFVLVQLTNLIDRISVLAFRDYCDDKLIEWSGWSSVLDTTDLVSFVEDLQADGGGDEPEAVKTGLWEASKKVEKPTICILYVDAPPHHKYKGSHASENYKREIDALEIQSAQWLNICDLVSDRRMRVYPVFPNLSDATYMFFVSLAERTSGQCVEIGRSSVVRATIGILLNLAGVEFEYDKLCSNVSKLDDVVYETILADDSECIKTKLYKKGSVKIESVEDIKNKFGNPIANFQKSEEYKELAFTVFHKLLSPSMVMAFTYNTLFGKLWREICKQRKDPRRDELVEVLGRTVTAISDSDRLLLKSFIEETYDQTEEIERILSPYGVEGPFYVIDQGNINISRKALYEIGLSCAPSVVQSVLQLITGLRITSQLPSRDCNLTYIPVNLPSNLKFKMLPHLMCPGTMFSLRLSAIMATIAKISGSILQDDARHFLNEIKGKWIDLELPECNSGDFARLMMKVREDALTEAEEKHFRAIIKLNSLKRSKQKQIDVEISYTSYKTKRSDYKDECKTCGQWRSVTLLLDDTCALCVEEKKFSEPKTEIDESWMCECRKCLVHYAVCCVDDLKCKAKCHFCRLGTVAPFVTCKSCKNKFLHQRSVPLPDYVCAVCAQNGSTRVGQKCKVTVVNYILQNGARFIGMDIDATSFFHDSTRVTKMSPEERLKAVRNFENISEEDLMDHSFECGEFSKEVWNVKEIQQKILFAKLMASQCMICFEEFPLDKLNPICGLTKDGCSIAACRKCLTSWYNQLAPGRVCQPAQLVCCYCKRIPKIKIVRQYNRQLCTLMNVMDVTAFDPSYIYAWCMKCFVMKEAMPRECGREQREIADFQCVDCSSVTTERDPTKECPKCKVPTEKYGGCNHMACENVLADGTKCDAHWCWVCGVLSTDSEIYVHLSKVHGGFFSPEDIADIDDE